MPLWFYLEATWLSNAFPFISKPFSEWHVHKWPKDNESKTFVWAHPFVLYAPKRKKKVLLIGPVVLLSPKEWEILTCNGDNTILLSMINHDTPRAITFSHHKDWPKIVKRYYPCYIQVFLLKKAENKRLTDSILWKFQEKAQFWKKQKQKRSLTVGVSCPKEKNLPTCCTQRVSCI